MQNTIQSQKSLRFGSWILSIYVNSTWRNLWAIREWKLAISKLVSEIAFDNAKANPRVKIEEAILSANLHEINLEVIQAIDWFSTYSTVAGTQTTITDEPHGTWWTIWQMIRFDFKNADWTQVPNIVIKNNSTTLVLNTDYSISLWSDWYTYLTPITAQTWLIKFSYKYTPNQSKEMLFKDIQKALSLVPCKFENFDENWKAFWIEFFQAYNKANAELTFLADDTTDDTMSLAIEMKAYPVAGSQNMLRIYDEQDV